MMIYDAIVNPNNGRFVVARPTGWRWTATERAEFEIVQTDDLRPAPEEYAVELTRDNGSTIAVSSRQIDRRLYMPAILEGI